MTTHLSTTYPVALFYSFSSSRDAVPFCNLSHFVRMGVLLERLFPGRASNMATLSLSCDPAAGNGAGATMFGLTFHDEEAAHAFEKAWQDDDDVRQVGTYNGKWRVTADDLQKRSNELCGKISAKLGGAE